MSLSNVIFEQRTSAGSGGFQVERLYKTWDIKQQKLRRVMAYQKGKELTSGDVRRPKTSLLKLSIRAILVWPWKMVSVSVRYLFCQPTDEKIKTWPLRFAKDNPNMEKALFDWPIVLLYDVTAKYRLISRKFSGMKLFHPSVRLTNQKPRRFVSVRQTNQIALFPFVCRFCFVRAFAFQGHTKMNETAMTQPFKTWTETSTRIGVPSTRRL